MRRLLTTSLQKCDDALASHELLDSPTIATTIVNAAGDKQLNDDARNVRDLNPNGLSREHSAALSELLLLLCSAAVPTGTAAAMLSSRSMRTSGERRQTRIR